MGPVLSLTVRQLLSPWRIVIMTVLAGLPVLFAILMMRGDRAPSVDEFEIVVFGTMLFGSIAPLILVASACVVFGNEIEDRTLANLTLTPIPRWQIVAPKLFGSVFVAAPFIVGSAFFASLIGFNGDTKAVTAVTTAAVVSVVLYSSLFVWLGLVVRQAIGVGLLYVVLWEGFFSGYVSGIRLFSIRHYTAAWMNGLDPRRFAGSPHVGLEVAVLVTVGLVALFFLLTTRHLRRMDVP